jgi:predicted NUDIX family phosphoesterase
MEIVLGVKRTIIEGLITKDFGFIEDNNYKIITDNLSSMNRDLAEVDVTFKQIIPYLFIENNEKFLLYTRTKKQTEKRLHDKRSLGVGGHINPIDSIDDSDPILLALLRELDEEVSIKLKTEPQFLGFINDDLSDVGKVHLGMVFYSKSDSENFEVLEKDKMICEWVKKEYLIENLEKLESWSQIIVNSILK